MRVNPYKLAKQGETAMLTQLEDFCFKIKKVVGSKPHRRNFIYDAAHNRRVTEGSVMEGLTACAAEDQGFFNRLCRSTEQEFDFMDELGLNWDIKSAYSVILDSAYKFKVNDFISKIEKSLYANENIIIDMTCLNLNDLTALNQKLSGLCKTTNIHAKILLLDRENRITSKFI